MTYRLYGALASPYSVKMRALLRYRRIPHVWIEDVHRRQQALGEVRVPVIPVLEYPDGRFANDSTPLIFDLEKQHAGRSVVPPDPAFAFVACLIEDFADEWLTKPMFLYRWRAEIDQKQLGDWLIFDSYGAFGDAQREAAAKIRERQVSRLPMVAGPPDNAALIEKSTKAVLAALEAQMAKGWFLFGSRPSLAEFALFGQLKQLATDPTPQSLMRAQFPLTYRWLDHVEDLSGVEGEWQDGGDLSAGARSLLAVVGEVYLPFLAANDAAVEAGADQVDLTAMGERYTQAPFKFQAKCLAALRERHAALGDVDRGRVDLWFEEAGTSPAPSYLKGRG